MINNLKSILAQVMYTPSTSSIQGVTTKATEYNPFENPFVSPS